MSEEILNVLIAVISVIVGFFLSESSFFIKKNRDKRRLVSTFSSELQSIKSSLKEQILSNSQFIDGLNDYKFKNPRIAIGSNIEFIQTLDRLVITSHYRKLYKDDGKKIRNIYNHFNVIQFEIERFKNYLDEFNSMASEIHESYNKITNKIIRYIGDFVPDQGVDSIKYSDPIKYELMRFVTEKMLNKGKISEIIPFKSTLHEPLFRFFIHNGVHKEMDFKLIQDFNREAFDILVRYILQMDNFKSKMQVINESLERSFDKIFK